jgi:hypothetical protein
VGLRIEPDYLTSFSWPNQQQILRQSTNMEKHFPIPIATTSKAVIITHQQQVSVPVPVPVSVPVNAGDSSRGLYKLLNNPNNNPNNKHNNIPTNNINSRMNVLFVSDTKPKAFEQMPMIKKPTSSLNVSFASAMKAEIMPSIMDGNIGFNTH